MRLGYNLIAVAGRMMEYPPPRTPNGPSRCRRYLPNFSMNIELRQVKRCAHSHLVHSNRSGRPSPIPSFYGRNMNAWIDW